MGNLAVPEKLRSYLKPDGRVAKRPLKEQIYMTLAAEMAKQATCDRLQVGAVFTDVAMTRVLCAGYNGSHVGGPNGCDSTEVGQCGCLHAEVNALTQSRDDLAGSVCFVTTQPCKACAKALVNRGASRVVYLEGYRNNDGVDVLRSVGVLVEKYGDLVG